MRLDVMEDHDDVMINDDVIGVTPRGVTKRRANKHLIERRRRARINCSLTQLKSLVLEGMRKDPARYTRLEKADVLELTVTHLKTVRSQRLPEAASSDPQLASRYEAGFTECARQVSRFLEAVPELQDSIRKNILTHLGDCMQRGCKALQCDTTDSTGGVGSAILDSDTDSHGNLPQQPLDLSVAGGNRGGAEVVGVEEMECYTIHKYGSDSESVASSQDLDLPDGDRAQDSRSALHSGLSCAESVDSGLDDLASSSSAESHELRPDGGCHGYQGYQGEEDGSRLQDDPMWRPW